MPNDTNHDRTTAKKWQEAQEWERCFWMRDQRNMRKWGKNLIWKLLAVFGLVDRYRGDDRNSWWSEKFEGYNFLPAVVDNAIELGCGPYTNMRFIQRVCKPEHLVLSDPLIRTYIEFSMTFVRELYLNAGCMLDDHPLEELPFDDQYFDLSVMINVLDHVRDAQLCMKNLVRIVKPGGILILGQDLTNKAGRERTPQDFRTGHPITLDGAWFEAYLSAFEPILSKIVPVSADWERTLHYGSMIFAGIKRIS